MKFLENSEHPPRSLNINVPGMTPVGLFLGQGSQGLEVAVFSSKSKPAAGALQNAFKERKAGRATPVLVVILHTDAASLCGTGGDQPPILMHRTSRRLSACVTAHCLYLTGTLQ